MIKILSCKNKNYLTKLSDFLNKRRSEKNIDTSIVLKILSDIKKNKLKAVIKYEKKFGNNNKIKPTSKEINKSIKNLVKIVKLSQVFRKLIKQLNL